MESRASRGAAALESVADGPPPRVVDPLLRASDGTALLERRARGALASLIQGASLVTPNLPEAAELTGEDTSDEAGATRAAERIILDLGADAALVTGGHRDGGADDIFVRRRGADLERRVLRGSRIETPPLHGTGCALSSAIAARIARGEALEAAVVGAREFLRAAIGRAVDRPEGAPRLLDFGETPFFD